ncbi:MAG: pH regulation protein F [Rhodospirillales bacterium]|nr:pH regulation protein F [Rhodospirillales bacterium]
MFAVAAFAVLVTMSLALIRSIKGPTVYDRILAVNAFGTLTVVLISVYGFMSGRPDFLDLALVYALINFIATIAVSKFVEFSHMGRPTGGDELGDI